MTPASLELCQDLFDLSGWDNKELKHEYIKTWDGYDEYDLPLYTLGYLLRKLPANIWWPDKERYVWATVQRDDQGYQACYEDVGGFTPNDYICFADTPEDATAKLAIELFKQGVLTQEGTGSQR